MPPQAAKTRTTFRMEYRVAVDIQAPPKRVWSLLTNAKDFPRWNPTVTSIEGDIRKGERLALRVPLAPKRVFKPSVIEFEPERRMVWADGAAPMFRGVRTFTLTPRADGVAFEMAEVFSGLMLPMIAPSLPDFAPAFEAYAAALKSEAENGGA